MVVIMKILQCYPCDGKINEDHVCMCEKLVQEEMLAGIIESPGNKLQIIGCFFPTQVFGILTQVSEACFHWYLSLCFVSMVVSSGG